MFDDRHFRLGTSLLGRECDLYTFISLFPSWLANRLDTAVSPSFSLVPVPSLPKLVATNINPSEHAVCFLPPIPLRHLLKTSRAAADCEGRSNSPR
jgi:hypothetical protein